MLPESKLRVLMGCWSPDTIVDLVNLGIDVFDSSYPYLMSEKTKGLIMSCDQCNHERKNSIDLSEKR